MIPLVRSSLGKRSLQWIGVATFFVAVGAVMVSLASGPERRLALADQLSSTGGFIIGIAALFVSISTFWASNRIKQAETDRQLNSAAEELAEAVEREWRREASQRGLQRPEPIRIRWSTTGRPVAPSDREVFGELADEKPRVLHGDVTDIAIAWRGLPAQQLVTLGEPGAGKTCLAVLLALGMLANRQQDEPVPVLLTLSAWQPQRQHFEMWLARKVIDLYPMLTDETRFGRSITTSLITRKRIVPILDGLDEMPEDLRSAAIEALTEAVGRDRPLVLTCRTADYERLIATTGSALARAAVVELQPVTGPEAASYLPGGQAGGDARWARVTTRLRTKPHSVVARTMSTPLMVFLARTAYRTPAANPDALLTFRRRDAMETHLLDAYIDATYANQPQPPGSDRGSRHYSSQKAHRWLTFVARYLRRQGVREFAWWHVIYAVPIPVFAIVTALVGGVAFGAGFLISHEARVPGSRSLSWFSVVLGAIAAFSVASTSCMILLMGRDGSGGQPSRWLSIRTPHLFGSQPTRVLCGIILGTGIASAILVLAAFNGEQAAEVLPLALLVGPLAGITLCWARPASPEQLTAPSSALRSDCLVMLTIGGAVATAAAVAEATVNFGNRAAALLAFVQGFALTCSMVLMFALPGSMWLKFAIARCWLTIAGRLPWRLMPFLDDAYRRGVLRRVGAEYQFRHARLQDYLAPPPSKAQRGT